MNTSARNIIVVLVALVVGWFIGIGSAKVTQPTPAPQAGQNTSVNPFVGLNVPGVKNRDVPKDLKLIGITRRMPALLPKVASDRESLTAITPKAGSWYVHGVILTTGYDASSTINQLGDKFHVSPIFMAAVAGTESGYNPVAERWAGGLDNSCGLMQQIITNVTAITGLYGRAACNWEEVPYNSMWYGTLLMAQYIAQHGGRVQPPQAYVMYNAGPGYSDSYYYNPQGVAYTNYVGNFLPNFNYAIAHFSGGSAPTPQPQPKPTPRPTPKPVFHFPFAAFGHLTPYYDHHGFSWAATVWLKHRWLGHALDYGHYYSHKYGYTKTRFQWGDIYTWPAYRRAKVVESRNHICTYHRNRCE